MTIALAELGITFMEAPQTQPDTGFFWNDPRKVEQVDRLTPYWTGVWSQSSALDMQIRLAQIKNDLRTSDEQTTVSLVSEEMAIQGILHDYEG